MVEPPANSTRKAAPLLPVVCILGLFCVLAVVGGLIFFNYVARPGADGAIAGESSFVRMIREYDQTLNSAAFSGKLERLLSLLDDLDDTALGVESRLMVLKRRRNLVLEREPAVNSLGADPVALLAQYRAAAERGAAAYPYSESLAAIAAEALVLSAVPVQAASYASIITEPELSPLALSVHILAGTLASPEAALAILGNRDLPLGETLTGFPQGEVLIADGALLRLIQGETQGAAALLRPLISGAEVRNPEITRLAADFYYDFGDPLLAAELFAQFSDPESLARQADALALAGRLDAARGLWTILAAPDADGRYIDDRDILIRSLYNLAATETGPEKGVRYLERLLALDGGNVYGIIRYTRLLESSRAAVILEGAVQDRSTVLLELELLHRRRDIWPVNRIIPETWLLLNRYPTVTELYQWAAWYFDVQRQYDETSQLIRSARNFGMDSGSTGSPWIPLHESLGNIRLGNLNTAERLLRSIPPEVASWQVNANLALVLESKGATSMALEYYQTAAAQVHANWDAARVQVSLARCLRALGRPQDAREALEYALNLDPDNPTIRLEINRPSY
ncbi:MAG: tetratricopeptide repeat protein [Treponema sp.]|nr:tetratricopeptide repeat protein [Treponema sp.]